MGAIYRFYSLETAINFRDRANETKGVWWIAAGPGGSEGVWWVVPTRVAVKLQEWGIEILDSGEVVSNY